MTVNTHRLVISFFEDTAPFRKIHLYHATLARPKLAKAQFAIIPELERGMNDWNGQGNVKMAKDIH
jgi:hypothetical protein